MATVKRGLLLLNLGTPDGPQTAPVRRYLREFLSDGRVIDINAIARWLLLNLVILPTRPAKSAHAYRQIWTPEGSPLLVFSRALTDAVATQLGADFEVALGMRYGTPSIAAGIATLKARGITELTVLPLYPQYAASSYGSSQDEVMRVLGASWDPVPVRFVPPFYDDDGYLAAFTEVASPLLSAARPEHVLFSFHGLPERQIRKSDPSFGRCLSFEACCAVITQENHRCYRAQAYFTARALALRLGLIEGGYSVSFQSRLGRTPWIKPYTDLVIPQLAQRGIKRLAVMVPSFVADCLETLEEVALRARDTFLQAGGEAFTFVPSLNAHPRWVDAVAAIARR